MTFFEKMSVLKKHEIFERFSFFVKRKTGFYKKRIDINCSFNEPNKIDIFNDSNLLLNNNVSFEYGGRTQSINSFSYLRNDSPWYSINLDSFPSDIREYWEYNRLQFLNPILSNYLITSNDDDLKFIDSFLNNWFKSNPLEKGWNHVSNLEIAIRSLVFYRIWFYIGNKISIDLAHVLYVYGLHLYHDLPRTNVCTPNNHSLGEAVVLLFLGYVFRQDKWVKLGRKTVSKRFDLFTEYGESKEESSGYLLFSVQMFVFLSSFTHEFDDKLEKLLPHAFKNLALLSDSHGNVAQVGDCDFGLFYCFDNLKRNSISSLCLPCFCNSDFLNRLFIDSHNVLLPTKSQYYLSITVGDIRVGLVGGFEINHGHNQSLSFLVWVNGEQVILNPGTFRYNNITKAKRLMYVGSSYQNTPISKLRDNLITTFRHKKMIKKIELTRLNSNSLIGRVSYGKETITRLIEVNNDSISVTDSSTSYPLGRHRILALRPIAIDDFFKTIKTQLESGFFSPCYGQEVEAEYISIIPYGNNSRYSLIIK